MQSFLLQTDGQLCTSSVAILSWLLKTKEETCVGVVRQGGVEVLLRCCSCCRQPDTVRYCSLALCHLALYGGTRCHLHMVQHKVRVVRVMLGENTEEKAMRVVVDVVVMIVKLVVVTVFITVVEVVIVVVIIVQMVVVVVVTAMVLRQVVVAVVVVVVVAEVW